MNTRGTELGANKRPMGINWRAWNILTFTDGGVRKRRTGDEAGIGWVVVGIRGRKVMRLIEGFRFLEKEGGRVDSFRTEVWALWDTVRHMDEFMRPRTISLMAGERWVPRYEDYITGKRDWVDKDYDTKAISEELTSFTKFTKEEDERGGQAGGVEEAKRKKEEEGEGRGRGMSNVKFEAALKGGGGEEEE